MSSCKFDQRENLCELLIQLRIRLQLLRINMADIEGSLIQLFIGCLKIIESRNPVVFIQNTLLILVPV